MIKFSTILLLIFILFIIPISVRADGTYSNPGTGDAADCSSDCLTWSQSPTWVVDKYGKFILTTQLRGSTTHFMFSNDAGATWTQSSEAYSALTRGSVVYDSINDVLHVLWMATAASDGMIYRRYSITRNGSNDIISIQRMDTGVNLQLDTSASRSFEQPIAFWVNDGSTNGILVALWTKYGSNLTEIRGSMRRLSMTNADNIASNWLPLDGSAATFLTDPPAVNANKIYGSTTTGTAGVAAKIRGGSGLRKDDLYIFPAVDISGGGTSAVLGYRLAWNSSSKDWSSGTTNIGTIGSMNNSTGGYNLKWQLLTKPVIDTTNDRLYISWARWKDNSAGDTVSAAYLNSTDAVSSPIDIYSANGTHSYAPTMDIAYDNTGNKLYIAYVLSTTNGDNGSIEYKTYDGSTLSSSTRYYTSPGGTGGANGSADIPLITADRIASNNRIYVGFRINGALPPTGVNPHTLRTGYIQLSAPVPTPTVTPTPTITSTPTPTSLQNSANTSSAQSNNSTATPSCANEAPSSTPDLFQIDALNTKAILFFAPASGSVNKYMISYGIKSGDESYGIEFNQETTNGALSYTINNLSSNTTYYFRVRAGNGCMPGKWSNEMNIKTTTTSQSSMTYYKNIISHILSFFPKQITNAGSGSTQPKKQVKATTKTCDYVVESGDSLWRIAVSKLGEGNKYAEIMKKNGLTSPVINIGQVLKVGC